jgi:outer membrane immunogenic protein
MAQGSAAFGGIYGVGGGYDWQRDSLVIGVEGDIAGAFRGRAVSVIAASGSGQFPFVSDKTEAIATVRARAGLALDRTLVYVTAGFATIETKSTAFNSYYSCCAVLSSFSWAPALALGGGLEYALDNHWTVGGEGLYLLAATNRNSATYLVPGAGVVTTTYGTSPSQALAKAGVNYKF